ncbi:hypothetical protein GHT07_04850 [Caenimonas koreensis DSM 17982]|uniref:Uncharacterized protein n=1 Tax=Caenimonas koreensis DSM 17982 TaxID=1121255 RepID=A0A844B0F2_9BURK|nr:hypothetical protein [Caenimonas koreensis]MRD46593.1 hypothetical protein [Caenimonas koreensis DSM 17982]
MKSSRMVCHAALAAALAVVAFGAGAGGLNSILKALKNGGADDSQRQPAQAQPSQGAAGNSGGGGIGAGLTERYCRQLYSVAGLQGKAPVDEALISDEFNLGARDFADAALEAFGPSGRFRSKPIPSPQFFANEFETDKVNVLYNLIRQYPAPQYVAALIAASRVPAGAPRSDPQAARDATVALALLHFFMQDKSQKPGRWRELIASMQGEEHYLSQVILARLIESGEWGPKDASKALFMARSAAGLPQKYRMDDMHQKTISPRHYVVTASVTQYEILSEFPNLPQRREFEQFLQQYRNAQMLQQRPDAFPELKNQLGPGLAAIERAAVSADERAAQALSVAVAASTYTAQKISLDSATRTRTGDVQSNLNVDGNAMAALVRELEKGRALDARQEQLFVGALRDARESGDRAVAMMPTMMSTMLNFSMQRGMGAMPAIIPYSRKLQDYSDRACAVVARADQAAMVKKLTVGPDDSSRNNLAAMVADK